MLDYSKPPPGYRDGDEDDISYAWVRHKLHNDPPSGVPHLSSRALAWGKYDRWHAGQCIAAVKAIAEYRKLVPREHDSERAREHFGIPRDAVVW